MKRRAAQLAAVTLLLGLAGPLSARGEPDVSAHPPMEDLAPIGPSVADRLGVIALRVQAALEYPELARTQGIQGEARLAFEIDADGHPRGVQLVESSGSQSLDRAARRALLEAGVLPHVAGRVTVPVRFALACDE